MPRAGSTAKACTLTKTPDRTTKVPMRESAKVVIASKTVQLARLCRVPSTRMECNNAVPASHGMKLTFSTGSHIHQPPQPSS